MDKFPKGIFQIHICPVYFPKSFGEDITMQNRPFQSFPPYQILLNPINPIWIYFFIFFPLKSQKEIEFILYIDNSDLLFNVFNFLLWYLLVKIDNLYSYNLQISGNIFNLPAFQRSLTCAEPLLIGHSVVNPRQSSVRISE